MIDVSPRSRGIRRPASIRAARPSLEGLEGRLLLYSTTGGSWTYPVRVTYSIVPDGTNIGGTPSVLQQVLATRSGWQQQIQKAAAAWEAVTGINFVQVPDDGSSIGTSGNQQGDPRFGDIRIGGMPQSSGQLAFAYAPPPFNGGTNAGDIFFNTSQSWQTNGSTYDLMTVAIHEFGHALGMGHSTVNSAVMYASYTKSKQALASDDTSGLQSIYGVRNPDPFDAAASNNSSKTATDITSYIDSSSQITLANPDITSSSDVDWFKVTAPSNTVGTMTVSMQATNLSSLVPGLTVYNANLQVPSNSTVTNSGGTITITTPGVRSGQVWYIKALAGVTGSTGIGAYGLLVNFGSSPQSPLAPPNTIVAAQPDLNPMTTPMGTGWVVDGSFIPLEEANGNGQANGHGQNAANGNGHGLDHIKLGDLEGYGDTLEVGDLNSHGDGPNGGRGARGSHHFGVPDHSQVPPNLEGMSAVPVTPSASVSGANSSEARAATRSRHRALSSQTETGRLRVVDAALARLGTHGPLSTSMFSSRPQEIDHPRDHPTITRAWTPRRE